MYSYVAQELPALIAREFPADMTRQAIFGHSMGCHGALTIALKNPGRFRSCSAFAPIIQPSTAGWSRPVFESISERTSQRGGSTTAIIADGRRFPELFVDQGTSDGFLEDGLRPWLLEDTCTKAGIPLTAHAEWIRSLVFFHFDIHG
jgi:S-formylglutathione hydrolase